MPLRAHIAALVLALLSGPALGADIVGYAEAFDVLFRVDLNTRSALEVGHATSPGQQRLANIEGLTYSPNGTLYAVSDANAVKTLLTIDSRTGLATVVGLLNLTGQNVNAQLDLSLAFTCDGRLWMASGKGSFWQVNPTNGSATLAGDLGVTVTGMAANGSQLYAAGSQGNNSLYAIDPDSARATVVGAYGSGANYVTTASPGFDASGQLWAILDYVPPQPGVSTVAPWSDLAQLDADSGTLTNLGTITAPSGSQSATDLEYIGLKGLAIAPVFCTAAKQGDPTPASGPLGLGLLTGLMMLLAGTRLRRRRQTS
jgi:hypothetical protein